MANKGEFQAFNKLLNFLRDGVARPVEEIRAAMDGELNMPSYRLSTYLYDMVKYGGATYEALKDGRKVVAYRVTNPEKFANWVMPVRPSKEERTLAKAAAKKPVAPKKVLKPVKPTKAVPAKAPGKNKTAKKPTAAENAETARQVVEHMTGKAKAAKPEEGDGVDRVVVKASASIDPDFDEMPALQSFAADSYTGVISMEEI